MWQTKGGPLQALPVENALLVFIHFHGRLPPVLAANSVMQNGNMHHVRFLANVDGFVNDKEVSGNGDLQIEMQ